MVSKKSNTNRVEIEKLTSTLILLIIFLNEKRMKRDYFINEELK
jgi:hypothetical protein